MPENNEIKKKLSDNKLWQIFVILLTALIMLLVTRSGLNVDQIFINERSIINHEGRLKNLEKDSDRTYEAILRLERKIDDLRNEQ